MLLNPIEVIALVSLSGRPQSENLLKVFVLEAIVFIAPLLVSTDLSTEVLVRGRLDGVGVGASVLLCEQ